MDVKTPRLLSTLVAGVFTFTKNAPDGSDVPDGSDAPDGSDGAPMMIVMCGVGEGRNERERITYIG